MGICEERPGQHTDPCAPPPLPQIPATSWSGAGAGLGRVFETPDLNEEEADPNSIVTEYLQEKKKYEDLRKQQPKKGISREDQTLALLDRFKSKLTQAIADTPENEMSEPEVEDDEGWGPDPKRSCGGVAVLLPLLPSELGSWRAGAISSSSPAVRMAVQGLATFDTQPIKCSNPALAAASAAASTGLGTTKLSDWGRGLEECTLLCFYEQKEIATIFAAGLHLLSIAAVSQLDGPVLGDVDCGLSYLIGLPLF
ncbi:Peptidyl-prolyl cis-trans isomerase CWC27 like protein [Chelonia mydas]|uniref:Peptidyl-prolyl cis-trans isomerase CWC27 like protein n=1 Tax=Chelonia mydas TaxID=8469 RepID=M7BLB1_CHEMY|nr:Peptidyl-prolyl cis-trans isomerase CWC27 like protein [Chelonia mydas]